MRLSRKIPLIPLLLEGLLLVLSLISHHNDPTALPGHNRQHHCPSLNRKASVERPLAEGLQVLLGAVRSLCYHASPKLSTTDSVVRGPDPPIDVFAKREAQKSYQKKCFQKRQYLNTRPVSHTYPTHTKPCCILSSRNTPYILMLLCQCCAFQHSFVRTILLKTL